MRLFHRPTRINLALQGGGAHGAFTWGVLDRLLEEQSIEIGWISAASAGSVNAVAVAAGMISAGRSGARAKLAEVWHAVHKAGVQDFLRLNPFLFGVARSASMAQVASLWSPYDFNPLGFDPLRRLLNDTIDFRRIRTHGKIEMLIAATEVATGHARLFRRNELTVDTVLASACLPTLHHAVEIEGLAYWDGGFSANPDLVTLAMESPVADTLIVQISPLVKQGLPTGAREIQAHANRLTFNAPLLRHIEVIEAVRETSRRRYFRRKDRLEPLARHRFHLIEAGRYTSALSDDSRMKPDLELLNHLFAVGRAETEKWISSHMKLVGKRSSVDLRAHFFEAPKEATRPREAQSAAPPATPQPPARRPVAAPEPAAPQPPPQPAEVSAASAPANALPAKGS